MPSTTKLLLPLLVLTALFPCAATPQDNLDAPKIALQDIYDTPQWGSRHANYIFTRIRKRITASKQVLIIAPFPATSYSDLGYRNSAEGREALRELLYSQFSNVHVFEPVERTQLDKIVGEQRLSLNDLFDQANVKKIGKLLGGDIMLVGRVTKDNIYVTVNWRLVSVETGKIIVGESTDFPLLK